MKKRTLKSLDINPNIGVAEIAGGSVELEVPRLSALRLFEIAKFLGVEIASLWDEVMKVVNDASYTNEEATLKVIQMLPGEMVPDLLSILLDIDQESASMLDVPDIVNIAEVYIENTDLKSVFSQARSLYSKATGKELPKLSEILPSMEQIQAETEKIQAGQAAQEAAAEPVSKN